MSNSKQVKIRKKTDELLKSDFELLKIGAISYDDVVKTCWLAWRDKRRKR